MRGPPDGGPLTDLEVIQMAAAVEGGAVRRTGVSPPQVRLLWEEHCGELEEALAVDGEVVALAGHAPQEGSLSRQRDFDGEDGQLWQHSLPIWK